MSSKSKKKSKTSGLEKRVSHLEAQQGKIETKRYLRTFDAIQWNSDTTNLVNLYTMNLMGRGTGDNQMIGDSVNLKALGYKVLLHNNEDDKAVYVRMAIIRTKDVSGMDVTGSQFFKKPDGDKLDFSDATVTQKFYLPINTDRCDVVDHKLIKLGARNTTYTNQFESNQIVKFYKEYKNGRRVGYIADGTPSEKYFLVFWGILAGMGGSTTNQAQIEITGNTTFYYHDA
jgi:hypothetical protein